VRRGHLARAALALLVTAGCRGTLSPLSNRLKVGEEPYIVFVADGEDGKGDLFASPPDGGKAFQITFTRVDERAPALSPDGSILAFLRALRPGDTSGASVVLLNLLSGGERWVDAPAGARSLAWSSDGSMLLVRTGVGIERTAAPPGSLALEDVPASGQLQADSAFRVLLGDPPVGEVTPCSDGTGICARLLNGESLTLSSQGTAPIRWGTDSVAYLEGSSYVVRPLGGGRTRAVKWHSVPGHPRELTYFGGIRRAADGQ
jgi:WD40-like Beta Propeller Repeat